jgi:hypothetical protein
MDFLTALLPLNLFPQGSLSSSIITTVWIGIFIVAFFSLRFGWVLSGLVVPGYVAPLMILKPWAASVIMGEAMVTYGLVWFFSEYLSRYAPWCNFFGRDRFFALVLVSIFVRLLFDVHLLPMVGAAVTDYFNLSFDYLNQLHSFGLIIVALIANQFWKTGLVRGLLPVATTVLLTFVIIRYGLMEYTNFNISNIGYMYEDLAASILSAPKAYIILVTTAYIASRMNLYYSWDFSGILIPSLLALQWYEPLKILTSFAEAFIILGLGHWLLSRSIFKSMTLEGARKLLLFFNISFVYKMILGYVLLWFAPDFKATDAYGFGYLLSTLIAIKMHDKHIAIRMTRIVLQISIVGVLVASVIGFSLSIMPRLDPLMVNDVTENSSLLESQQPHLMSVVQAEKISLYKGLPLNSYQRPLAQELDLFEQGLDNLLIYRQTQDKNQLYQASRLFAALHYESHFINQRYFYLREKKSEKPHGWGLFLVDLQPITRLLLQVPAPLDEKGTLDAGIALFVQMQAQALAIAGTAQKVNDDLSSDMLRNRNSLFYSFYRKFARQNVLQIRTYADESNSYRQALNLTAKQTLASSLWIKGQVSEDIDLPWLQKLLKNYQLKWESPPKTHVLRDDLYTGFAELFLTPADLRRVLFSHLLTKTPHLDVHSQRIDGFLQQWLLTDKNQIAAKNSQAYQPPTLEQLLFADEEIITPLLQISHSRYDSHQKRWTTEGLAQLRVVAAASRLIGYELIRYRERSTQRDYLILREVEGKKHHWGTYVFRLGAYQPYMVQVPRPLFEHNSFEYAVALFERIQAQVLLIAGTHPDANLDRSADIIQVKNKQNLFNLINQVVLRQAGNNPYLVVHSRGFSQREDMPMSQADALLATYQGVITPDALSPLGERLYKLLQQDGLSVDFVNGSLETMGYEIGILPQAAYLATSQNKDFIALWMSPIARQHYRQQDDNLLAQQFIALNIAQEEADLYQYIQQQGAIGHDLPPALQQRLNDYLNSHDIVVLDDIQRRWPSYPLRYLIDKNSRQAFLLLSYQNKITAVLNLFPRDTAKTIAFTWSHQQARQIAVTRFIQQRAAWLVITR